MEMIDTIIENSKFVRKLVARMCKQYSICRRIFRIGLSFINDIVVFFPFSSTFSYTFMVSLKSNNSIQVKMGQWDAMQAIHNQHTGSVQMLKCHITYFINIAMDVSENKLNKIRINNGLD